jgi:hypothetical protein
VRSILGFAILALVSGCFVIDPPDGALRCHSGDNACPEGYSCVEGYCSREGGGGGGGGSGGGEKKLGDSCDGNGSCESGHCVDGVCCNVACDGACQACDVAGSAGTCATVTGTPHPGRSCNGTGLCGGSCDGTAPTCSYPSSSIVCGAACDGTCDGKGSCSSGGGSCPGGFACGTSACLTSCTKDEECAPNFTCNTASSACERIAESDCLDGIDNNGDGKIDCDDPTCTEVQCVAAVPAGAEVGLMNASGCAGDTGFPTVEPQNQNLSQPSCTGCGCAVDGVCRLSGTLYFGQANACGGSVTSIPAMTSANDGNNGTCVNLPTARVYEAYRMNAVSLVSNSCHGTGTATVADPTFGVKTNFCAARRVSTNNCGGDTTKICAPKPKAATAKMCVRVPGSGAGCPAGYGAGSSAVYYSGAQKAVCGSCSCSPGSIQNPKCDQPYAVAYRDANCTGGGGLIINSTTCDNQYYGLLSPSVNVNSMVSTSVQVLNASVTGTCTATAPTTPAQPTGASLICCQ